MTPTDGTIISSSAHALPQTGDMPGTRGRHERYRQGKNHMIYMDCLAAAFKAYFKS
jgi:hypothetical protein